MFQYDIEEIILGMADIVKENRYLRDQNNVLSLQVAKQQAFVDTLVCYNPEKEAKYKILTDIESQNDSCKMCAHMGWMINQEYIEDWKTELNIRLKKWRKENNK